MKKIQYPVIILAAAISFTSFAPLVSVSAAPVLGQISALSTDVSIEDTLMYRGIVTELTIFDGVITILCAQAEGTNFGSPTLSFTITEDTKLNFNKEDLKEGAYLEVFYTPTKSTVLQRENAILINQLVDAKFSNYNGTVVEITPDKEKKGFGDILLKDAFSDNETLFHYTDETKSFLDLAKVKKGDKLNIYHKGMLTRSIPPQGNALEIRTTANTSLYRGTVTKVSTKKGITTLSLKRAAGTNFPKNTVIIQMNKNTKSDISATKIKKGMYLEIFYENSKKTPVALSVNQLYESNAVVYNGIVTEVNENAEKAGYGSITMTDLNGKNETIFHYSPFTKSYIPFSNLKKDTKVSIYHKGISTMSLPPQCVALELSAYVK